IPVVVTRTSSSRSAAVSTTGLFFCEPITPTPFRQKGSNICRTPPSHPNNPELSNDTLLAHRLGPVLVAAFAKYRLTATRAGHPQAFHLLHRRRLAAP
ncbi:hypothetical protein ABZT45_47725, partial [Streptomyces sp. NPDC005356]|uniref:hypothetical protein n=1 Tax=Streptomyces sp. NPDC005356 TaxID=3157167 RepID=UPI0033AE4AEF